MREPPVISLDLPIPDLRTSLHEACKNWGIFRLTNHGIKSSEMADSWKQFFDLNAEIKKQMKGYATLTIDGVETEQVLTQMRPEEDKNMPIELRNSGLMEYTDSIYKLSRKLLALLSRSLNLDECYLGEIFSTQSCVVNFYPCYQPIRDVIGFYPHCDLGGITILMDNNVAGLQFKKPGESEWTPLAPLDGALIIFIADQLQVISNGEFKSLEHQVMMHGSKCRITIVCFHSPSEETIIRPMFNNGRPLLYQEKTYKDFFKYN